ncbi:ferritin family protein [Mycolicibacterium gadium]|uniref:propane 2-monooxygenase n=1 Tax=Mycolicibacterium gadium TaxID=1794 RepID=A0ABT6H0A4_MYCGU|nr:toluene hydroxylase [Mycolicibacterium gadium]MDG5486857.1 toluene hydroxylase [Mycolicibacterium gadium]
MATDNRRVARRTWSMLGDVKRKPSPYEVVTSKFHYHFRREPAPFELDPETPINKWYLRYREGSALQVADWERFRDPYKLTYTEYIKTQKGRETYVDGLIDQYEASGTVAHLEPGWVDTLKSFYVPLRFPLHVLQMVGMYVGQMAPSSFITNCAHFQAADEMRRIQRIAYWNRVLANAHGDELAQTDTARRPWESAPEWQPLRRLLEELLIAYDWGEAFTALNLAVKPAIDALLNWEFAALAQVNGDQFIAQLFSEFTNDSKRSQEWTQALVHYMLECDSKTHIALDGWLARWQPAALAAVDALAPLFGTAPSPLSEQLVSDSIAKRYTDFIHGAGLSVRGVNA